MPDQDPRDNALRDNDPRDNGFGDNASRADGFRANSFRDGTAPRRRSRYPGLSPASASASPDLLRGLTRSRISRRTALQLGGVSAAAAFLAACGVPAGGSAAKPTGTQAVDEVKAFWAKQQKHGQLNFASYPLYIDVSPTNKNDHPSIDLFTKQTGIKVNYQEVIQDLGPWFGKIQPQLAAGQSIGYDLMVITNGVYLTQLLQLNYLVALDQSKMTNFYANASSTVKNPSYDPGNVYTMAWQSGMTGIAYNKDKITRKITSWQDLLDPAFKGKIGMFKDNDDLPNAALCAIGVNPEKSTEDDWHKAADWLIKQRPLVRQYYYQDYVNPLSNGDIWISMGWSGDIFQANESGANLEFVIPEEGCPFWTDNMCIPAHAANPVDAMAWMDFVYDPKPAAMLAEYIAYVTPVPGAQKVIEADAAAATGDTKTGLEDTAKSPLVFPPQADFARFHRYRTLTQAELKTWNSIFEPVYQA